MSQYDLLADVPRTVYCVRCKEKVSAPHFLSHARFKHPVEWENWSHSRLEFGISIFQHVHSRKIEKGLYDK